jgi:tripartite-type tricarboxylate transporter receptor subunit TctC
MFSFSLVCFGARAVGACKTLARHLGVVTVLLCLCVGTASAQQPSWHPSKPIRLVVPFPPGGGIDIVGRFIAPGLERELGQNVIIDNRAGANGLIGSEFVERAPADGYTLVVGSADTHSINPYVYASQIRNDDPKEATAIAPIAHLEYMLVARPGLSVASAKDAVELARRQRLSYASSGVGSSAQLTMEAFKQKNDLKLLHVPFNGTGPAVAALMGDHVDLEMLPVGIALANRTKLKILGIASSERFDGAPEIPTLAEQGFPVGVDACWIGLMGPPNLPSHIRDAIFAAIEKIIRDPGTKERFLQLGLSRYTTSSAEAFAAQTKDQLGHWSTAAKDAGIKAE